MKLKTFIICLLCLSFGSSAFSQTLTSVVPDSAIQCQHLSITVSGENTNFYQGTSSLWLRLGENGPGIFPVSETVLNSDQIVGDFYFNPQDEPGLYDVHAYNGANSGDMVLEDAFNLLAVDSLPQLFSSEPGTANTGETLNLSIVGKHTHFDDGNVNNDVWLKSANGGYINNYSIVVIDALNMEVEFQINFNKPAGYYDLHLTNLLDGDLVLEDALLLIDSGNSPEISNVEPDSAYQGEQLTISVSGKNTTFQQGSSMLVLKKPNGNIYPTNFDVINDTLILGDFNFTFDDSPGTYDVMVLNWDVGDVGLTDGFQLLPSVQPSVSSFSPQIEYQGKAVYFMLQTQNTHYNSVDNVPALTLVQASEELYSKQVEVIDSVTVKAKFIFSYANTTGYKKLIVDSPFEGELTLENAFLLETSEPGGSIVSVLPDTAVQGETISVSVTGTDIVFMQGTSNLRLSQGSLTISPNSENIIDDSTVVGEFNFLNTFPTGKYDVKVEGDYAWPDVFLSEGFELKLFNFIDEQSYNSFLSIYPNPCKGNLNLERLINSSDEFVIQVFDIDGKLLLEDKLLKNQDTKSLDLSFLSKGTYILNVIMNNKKQSRNFVIQ
ncbi:MAG: T9SS type A sorting domain-containing protein [Chlorobi bacterium]|nr:T9SS type A sorting domain-containing protein [Chlorobiota bacterium]